MKTYVPNYYRKFRCISSACRHTCCAGWEIDVDEEAYQKYQRIGGELGEKLRSSVVRDEEGAHFALLKGERCPFLQEDGLCELIIKQGEEALCQICADHPRFRNFYRDRVEMGLGLCCEAAAELVLNEKEKFSLDLISDDEKNEEASEDERLFYEEREHILSVVQNRNDGAEERVRKLQTEYGINAVPVPECEGLFSDLEFMDEAAREKILESIKKEAAFEPKDDLPLEQLLCAFLYRHLSGALEDGGLRERIAFCVLSVQVIYALWKGSGGETLAEQARMYSSEIEYSDENVDAILDFLNQR